MEERIAGKRQDKLHYSLLNSLPHYPERGSAPAKWSFKYLIILKYGLAG